MAIALSLICLSLSAAWVSACVAALLISGADAAPPDAPWAALGAVSTTLVLLFIGTATFAFTLISALKRLQGSALSDTAPAKPQRLEGTRGEGPGSDHATDAIAR